MNNTTEQTPVPVSEEKKSTFTKVFAIVGFVAIIVLMMWLSVKIVTFVPSAFSSLASIADSVYNYDQDQTLSVSTQKSVINAGEAFTINYEKLSVPGTYTFAYTCTDGVSAEVRNEEGSIVAITCDTIFDISALDSLEVRVASEKTRFTDVAYSLTFTPANENKEPLLAQGLVTIVNSSMPTAGEVAEETETVEEETVTEEESAPGEVAGETTTTAKPPVVTKPTTPQYQYVEKVTYTTPVSNPNGTIDLQVTYKGVGTVDGKVFKPQASIEVGETGAIQFEVKNNGTKTSNSWTYEALLPSGIEYTSGTQKPLKPQERALITIGFDGISETGTEKFGVELETKQDIQSSNNSFTWAVKIVD
jgi:hypothetical protein